MKTLVETTLIMRNQLSSQRELMRPINTILTTCHYKRLKWFETLSTWSKIDANKDSSHKSLEIQSDKILVLMRPEKLSLTSMKILKSLGLIKLICGEMLSSLRSLDSKVKHGIEQDKVITQVSLSIQLHHIFCQQFNKSRKFNPYNINRTTSQVTFHNLEIHIPSIIIGQPKHETFLKTKKIILFEAKHFLWWFVYFFILKT